MKIFLDGRDNVGWSIDSDRNGLQASLARLGIPHTAFLWSADIVHNLWWNSFLNFRKIPLRLKKNILFTASNFIDPENRASCSQKNFETAKKIAKGWIAPSKRQQKILDSYGLRTYYQPFYLDLNLFSPKHYTKINRKNEILKKFSIPKEIIENKIIIGSFQRDSLGSDLNTPKWQKGPDILVQLLKKMPQKKFVLLLAGPRRHYIIKECRKHNIPYFFVGNESRKDDLFENKLDHTEMPLLYALTDIYLVTSKSEGGPKAIQEAAATKTFILSTDVGLASDFLPPQNVFSNLDAFAKQLFEFIQYAQEFEKIRRPNVEQIYSNCRGILAYDKMDKRLLDIYTDILS